MFRSRQKITAGIQGGKGAGPQFVKRSRDTFVSVGTEHMKVLLASYCFKLEMEQEEDGSLSGSHDVIDVVTNASTVEKLKLALANELIEYAKEYTEDFALYLLQIAKLTPHT